jgi:hypothetical protein
MPIHPRTPDITNLLITEGEAEDLPRVSMTAAGWKEREDLQRWVREHSHLIEPDLLLVSEEFADWEGASGPVHDRLDLLFLDGEGRPLVVELKRGLAPDRVESQALLYAAYCDQLSTDDLVEQYSRTTAVDLAAARETLTSHAPALVDEQPGRVRVRIVAEDFPPAVTAAVLFLREIGVGGPEASQLDIGCIKLTAYKLPDGSHVISAQPIIPIPETEAFQVRRRRRQVVDDSSRQERVRVANAVPALQRTHAIAPGTSLRVDFDWFRPRDREAVVALIEREPSWAELIWTGEDSALRAVRQAPDEEPVSLNADYLALRKAAGLGDAPGATNAWFVGDTGKSVRQLADEVLAVD